jgi:antitoxin HicB
MDYARIAEKVSRINCSQIDSGTDHRQFDASLKSRLECRHTMKKGHGHFNVVLRPEPEGGFTALVPALPGCVTYGRTLDEAKKMARDAIVGYIESLNKHNEPIPTDNETLVASLDLEYAQASRR